MISKLLEAFSRENKESYLLTREDMPEPIRQMLEGITPSFIPPPNEKTESTLQEITDTVTGGSTDSEVMAVEPVPDTPPVYSPAPRPELADAADNRPLPLEAFTPCIRSAQRQIFNAIYNVLTEDGAVASHEQTSLVVDLPLQDGQSYHRYRCTIPLDGTMPTLHLLTPDLYKGEPLFPRLLVQNQKTLLPNDLRQRIYNYFLSQNNYSSCPLHTVPRLMLRLAYTKPDWSFAKMEQYINGEGKYLDGEKFPIKADTIKQHFKRTISKVALNFFEVSFLNNKDIGEYWPEMGFNLAPIPELSA